MSMLWQRFTERAKRVVIAAQEEAAHAGEPYVSPEHLLLGLVKENDSVATKVLERLEVAAARVRQAIEGQIGSRAFGRLNNNDVTLDPRMKRVLDFAYEEARQSNTNYIGTEHLLLGIIREGDGPAYRTLAQLGVDIISARKEVFSYLGGKQTAPSRHIIREGYAIQRFSDPDQAASWLNEMSKKEFQLVSSSASEGSLWLTMKGWIKEEPPETGSRNEPAPEQPEEKPRRKKKAKAASVRKLRGDAGERQG